MFVSRDSLNFFIENKHDYNDFSLWSDSLAVFFKISHTKEMIPLLKELHEKYPDNIKPHKIWSNLTSSIYVAFYVLDKEGCTILCKNIKAKPSLKKRFLSIVNIS